MPRIDASTGAVWAGIGDNEVSVNGRIVADHAGAACVLRPATGIFNSGAVLYSCPENGQPSPIDPEGANFLAAGANVYAAWFNGGVRVSNRPERYPGYNVGDVGPDGTVLLIQPDGTYNGVAVANTSTGSTLQSLGKGAWSALDTSWRPISAFVENVEVPTGECYGLRRYGAVCCYQNGGRFIVSKIRGRLGKVYEHVPNAHRPDIVVLPDGSIKVAFAVGIAERHNEIWSDILPMSALVEPILDAAEPIIKIDRRHWLLFFQLAHPPRRPPSNATLPTYGSSAGILCTYDGQSIAQYVSAEEEGTMEALNRAIATARVKHPDLPVVPYWTPKFWPSAFPNITDRDWLGPQSYCPLGMDVATLEGQLSNIYAGISGQFAIIAQSYDTNTGQTRNLSALVPMYSRLAKRFPRCIATIPFNDYGRPGVPGTGTGGLYEHPELMSLWQEYFAGITGQPPIVVEPAVKPSVTIKSYQPSSGETPLTVTAVYERNSNSGPIMSLHWFYSADNGMTWIDATPQGNDPDDPDHHYQFKAAGTYLIKLRAIGPGGLTDETVKRREVTVAEKPNGGGGSGGGGETAPTFTLRREDRSECVAVGADSYLTQKAGGAGLVVKDGGLYVSGRGFVAVEPPDWKGKADRGSVGEWERVVEEANADGTFSYKSLESKKYMSLADDFSVRFDKPNEGFWQRLVKETGGGVPFPEIRVDGKFFSTATGEAFHAIEATDFSLCKRLCDGEDVTPVVAQRAEIGFNVLRVWMLNASVMPEFSPRLYPQMYDRLSDLIALCGSYGIVVEVTAFTMCTGPTGLMNDEGEQRAHWQRICDVVRGKGNVLLEPYNEGDQYGGTNRPSISLSKPDGVISTRGSNGSDSEPPDHGSPWDYEVYHIIGNEWQRKTGHNAMEWADQSGHPCITNESQRFPDNDSSLTHAYDSAAGGALLCAGTCFHSQQGKSSLLFDGATLDCARAFVAGAKSVPLEYRTGSYAHETGRENFETHPYTIRSYSRTLGDGRKWFVDIQE